MNPCFKFSVKTIKLKSHIDDGDYEEFSESAILKLTAWYQMANMITKLNYIPHDLLFVLKIIHKTTQISLFVNIVESFGSLVVCDKLSKVL